MSAAPAIPRQAVDVVVAAHRARIRLARERDPWRTEDARPDQLPPPGDWSHWLIMAGRGWGKTRTGAEFVRAEVMAGRMTRVALVGRTAADVRDVMVEGPSGILAVCDRYRFRPVYEPSKRRLTFPNGAVAVCYSAEKPDALRGPEHDGYWADEVAAWTGKRRGATADETASKADAAWDNLMMGLRLARSGHPPRGVATTTPKPVPLVRRILALAADGIAVRTRGRTLDNAANLARTFLSAILRKYEGTRLGRQELDGELLEDVAGALWTLGLIEAGRVSPADWAQAPVELARVVVAVDPATSTGEFSDFTAVAVAGLGVDGGLYVLAAHPYKLSPQGWATRVIDHYDTFAADRILAEANNGGDMVASTIRTIRPKAPVALVHAKRGKTLRAEPIAALYEQGRVHHVGVFPELEDQMVHFPVAVEHDDLVDALVYALTDLATPVASKRLVSF